MTNIDLKLLAVVTELHKTRSVSQTAENLDLSQSAISMSLAKLRKQLVEAKAREIRSQSEAFVSA